MITWAYIAGFFDGEGSVGTSNGLHARLYIVQANEPVLQDIQNFLEMHGVISTLSRRVNISHFGKKPIYTLHINSRDSVSVFLKNTLPYLHVKRQKAKDALRYFILFPDMKFLRSSKIRESIFKKDNI